MASSELMARLNDEQRRAERGRPAERLVAEALAMGDQAVEAYARAEQCSRPEAQERLRRARQRGRLPSRVLGGP